MTEPLRPMSTGQLLDHTFALYRKYFLLFVGIASVGPAANVIFQLMTVGANVASPFGSPRHRAALGAAAIGVAGMGSMLLTMFFGYTIMLAGMAISYAATVKAVAAVHLGREISIVGAYKALRGRVWSVFGTFGLFFLLGVIAVVASGFILVPVLFGLAFLGRTAGHQGGIIGVIVGFVVVIFVFSAIALVCVRYALAIQACVVEDLGPLNSLSRSSALSKGSRWRIVVIYGIFLLLAVILGGGLGALAGGVGVLLHNTIAAAVLIYLAGFVAGSLTGPLGAIGLSLLYYDERVRKEAFDLQLMLSSLDAPAPQLPVPAQL